MGEGRRVGVVVAAMLFVFLVGLPAFAAGEAGPAPSMTAITAPADGQAQCAPRNGGQITLAGTASDTDWEWDACHESHTDLNDPCTIIWTCSRPGGGAAGTVNGSVWTTPDEPAKCMVTGKAHDQHTPPRVDDNDGT